MAIELKLWGESGTVQVSETAFGREFNEALVHQVVTAYLARSRAGTRAQKSRSAVRGGGAKPWRQKGTGRARVGTVRSPLWRSGGLTFAAQPRSYVQKVNRRMYQGAMRSILSELVRQDRLHAIGSETLALNAPKTRLLTAKLKEMGLTAALIVMEDEGIDENLYLATRNLPSVKMVDKQALDPVSLLRFETTLITVAALQQLEDWLG